ncbi:MAG: hypothetical protein EON93_17075 [Burkholderiales bacterium]|nr:MAG: hypothetical protein EON93_17075 [Burkholderiales bacterium]
MAAGRACRLAGADAAMVGFLIWRSAADVAETASDRLRAAARVVAVESREVVASTRARLSRFVGERPAGSLVTGAAPTSSTDELQGLFGFVLVFDETGHLKADNSEQPTAGIAGRDYFKALQAGADWSTSGLLMQSVFGEPVFAIARRLSTDNVFAGAAVMYVPADVIMGALPALDLGEHGSLALYRSDGVLVTRYPLDAADPPASLDVADLPNRLKGPPVVGTVSGGEPRLTAFASVDEPVLIAAASLPQRPIDVAASSRIMTTLFAVGPVAAVLLLVCGLMALALIRQERHLRALDEAAHLNETLLQEIHHRLKNNLQMVAAMVRLQPGEESDKQVLASRIQAMTAVHQLMYESNAYASLDAGAYVARLLEGLSPGKERPVAIEQKVDPIRLSADQVQPVQPIGLIINEAVTNAVKHAFPDGRPGTIRVELTQAGGFAELVIVDDGVGSELTAQNRMGSKLMRNLARQLGGELRTGAEKGTRVVVRFPLEERR